MKNKLNNSKNPTDKVILNKEFDTILKNTKENVRYKNSFDTRNIAKKSKNSPNKKVLKSNKDYIMSNIDNFDVKLDKYFLELKQKEKIDKIKDLQNKDKQISHMCEPCKRLQNLRSRYKHMDHENWTLGEMKNIHNTCDHNENKLTQLNCYLNKGQKTSETNMSLPKKVEAIELNNDPDISRRNRSQPLRDSNKLNQQNGKVTKKFQANFTILIFIFEISIFIKSALNFLLTIS